MKHGIPVLRFVYEYVTTGDLAGETIEAEATSEGAAHAIVRAKLDRNGMKSIALRLVDTRETKMRRSA